MQERVKRILTDLKAVRKAMKRLLDEFDIAHDEVTVYLRENRDAPDV